MARTPIRRTLGCWVDLYTEPDFMGQVRRLHGPAFHETVKAGSLIVGPRAYAQLARPAGRSGGTLLLSASRLVRDAAELGWGEGERTLTILDRPPDRGRALHPKPANPRRRLGVQGGEGLAFCLTVGLVYSELVELADVAALR